MASSSVSGSALPAVSGSRRARNADATVGVANSTMGRGTHRRDSSDRNDEDIPKILKGDVMYAVKNYEDTHLATIEHVPTAWLLRLVGYSSEVNSQQTLLEAEALNLPNR